MRKAEILGRIRLLEGRLTAATMSEADRAELLRRNQAKTYALKTELPAKELKGWRWQEQYGEHKESVCKTKRECVSEGERKGKANEALEHKLAELQRQLAALGK